MESTLAKYAARIERNEVSPHVAYDGRTSGLIFDPAEDATPLEVLGFGVYRLGADAIHRETGGKEMVLVPEEGEFEIEVDGKKFAGGRPGGPFAVKAGESNASAVYVPSDSRFSLRGSGEMAFFEAPSPKKREPFYVPREAVKVVSRGAWCWRRDVVNLVSPGNGSSNLIVGETYNPPGLWSGTPLHTHDRDAAASGESDHEEVYFHRFDWKREQADRFGAYGVQLLFAGKELNKAYLIGDKSAFAIPGACHPVAASPVSGLLYLWGLAGRGGDLAMKDVAEFAHLKRFEEILKEMEGTPPCKEISRYAFDAIAAEHALTERQKALLETTLREKGFVTD